MCAFFAFVLDSPECVKCIENPHPDLLPKVQKKKRKENQTQNNQSRSKFFYPSYQITVPQRCFQHSLADPI